jgi:hypothetical protein
VPDDPSATLSAIREDIEATVDVYNLDGAGKNSYPVSAAMVRHARVLVAALEAVLRQVDHFASEAERFGKLSETADEESGAALAALAAWQAYDRCAKTFRAATTTALTGDPANPPAPPAGTGETP